jgi:flagellar protein FliO/FliZ
VLIRRIAAVACSALTLAPAWAAQTASGAISGASAPVAAAAEAPAAAAAEAPVAPVAAAAAPAPTPTANPTATPAATPEQQAALLGARPAAMPAPPSATGSLLQTVFSLLVVLAVLVGLAWLLKRYGPKTVTGNANVKLVGALSVGARERILVVEVGEQWIVVGASPGRMNALATMPRQEGEALPPGPPHVLPSANFAEWFKQTIEKRNGK